MKKGYYLFNQSFLQKQKLTFGNFLSRNTVNKYNSCQIKSYERQNWGMRLIETYPGQCQQLIDYFRSSQNKASFIDQLQKYEIVYITCPYQQNLLINKPLQQKLNRMLQAIKQLKVSAISIYNVTKLNLTTFSKIQFKQNLIKLILSSNNIQSIQCLMFINMTNITHLDLSINNISVIDSLRKFNINPFKIKQLKLDSNFIIQKQRIREIQCFVELLHTKSLWNISPFFSSKQAELQIFIKK